MLGVGADRELRAETVTSAPPEVVWRTLTDLSLMPRWSPELVRMVPLKGGGLRQGQWYVGVNRRGWVVWPTRNVVSRVEPPSLLAWDTVTSGARWTYRLTPEGAGTRVTLVRDVPRRVTFLSNVVAGAVLGGVSAHADELEEGMAVTLERLRATAEGSC